MALRVSFDLTAADLKHFQLIMRETRASVQRLGADRIVSSARALLEQIRRVQVPQFVQRRLAAVETLLDMHEDADWQISGETAEQVLSALAYFGESEDLIPDHLPGLGFLDDAIMIELVLRELRHEIDAYGDFCAFRRREGKRRRRRTGLDAVTRDQWLAKRREALQARVRRRRGSGRRRLL